MASSPIPMPLTHPGLNLQIAAICLLTSLLCVQQQPGLANHHATVRAARAQAGQTSPRISAARNIKYEFSGSKLFCTKNRPWGTTELP